MFIDVVVSKRDARFDRGATARDPDLPTPEGSAAAAGLVTAARVVVGWSGGAGEVAETETDGESPPAGFDSADAEAPRDNRRTIADRAVSAHRR